MFLKKSVNEETVSILMKENKRLKREIVKKDEALQAIQKYKDEYEKLIEELNGMKQKYGEKLNAIDEIEKEYRKQLGKLWLV